MAIKFDKIKPGMKLLDIHSERMGNTTMRRLGMWPVEILSVNSALGLAEVSWNGNAKQTWAKRQLERLYTKPTKKYLEQQARSRW
jgi:hypothetical protein